MSSAERDRADQPTTDAGAEAAPAKKPRRGRRARTPLSRERVLRAAVALADERGLEALSMRKLGQKVGVEAMSLYNHVANKDDVLDGIVDVVTGELVLPDTDDWQAWMRQRAASLRAMFRRHPWAIHVMETRRTPGLATLRHHEAALGCLRRGGFSIGVAAHAISTIDSYIYGFALQEATLPFQDGEELGEVAEGIAASLPVEEFPFMAEMLAYAMTPEYDHRDSFDVGLALVLDGLERLRIADAQGGA